jgi:SPP1 gp7 family putative phage head morphogenesis protein
MPSTIAGIISQGQRDLARREAAATRRLVDAYTRVWTILEGEIAVIERQITTALQAGEIDNAERWAHRQRWWEQVQGTIGTELGRFSDDGLRLIAGVQQDAVLVATSGASRIANLARIDTPFSGRVNARAMERWVSALQPDSPLQGVFGRYSDLTRQAIMDGITDGIGQGKGAGNIVRAVRKVAGPDVSTGKLATITRTETMRAYRGSARDSYEALGPDVIAQWEWRAAKSRRTCAACLAYDGRRFPYKQYPQRFHVNCRCVVVPVPHKHLVGEGPERETGAAWLARQKVDVQRQVLGTKDRFALYQDGVPLRDFIGVKRNRTWGPSLYVKPADRVRLNDPIGIMPDAVPGRSRIPAMSEADATQLEPPRAPVIVSRDEATEYIKGSETPYLVYHRTSAEVEATIYEHGLDFSKTGARSWQGSGFYTSPESLPQYGEGEVIVALNAKKPFVGTGLEIDAKIDSFNITPAPIRYKDIEIPGTQVTLEQKREAWLNAGYDSLIQTADNGTPEVIVVLRHDNYKLVRHDDR